MIALFPDPDFDEIYGFSALHKVVLGLVDDRIDDVLHAHPTAIDQVDFVGRTPLMWASWRGDFPAVTSLISKNAGLHQSDRLGLTSLLCAARSNSVCCVEALLQAVADPRAVTTSGSTILHFIGSFNIETAHVVELLRISLDAGAKINALNSTGDTALSLAAEYGPPHCVEYLISRGANLELCSGHGLSPLCRAIQSNRHRILEILLNHGAGHGREAPIVEYGTFTHFFAHHADAQTLRLLLRYHASSQDINAKNKQGLTPLQLSFRRDDIDAEWRDLFVQLLKKQDKDAVPLRTDTETAGASSPDSDSFQALGNDTALASRLEEVYDSSEDEFEDAVEAQDEITHGS